MALAQTRMRGPGNETLVDGVAHRGAGGARAFRAHVALGSEAGHQVGLCGLLGQDHTPGNRLLDGLQVFGAGMQKQVHMRVDEAGKQRGVAEVDDLRALRMLDRRAHGANAFALDEDFAGLKQGSGIHLRAAAPRAARWAAGAGCCAATARMKMP